MRADLMVSYGFTKAFGTQSAALPFEPAPGGGLQRVEVGDEAYWLTGGRSLRPVLFDGRVAVGDRISITGRDGRVRNLAVISLQPLPAPLLKIAVGATPVPLLLVTCQVIDPADPERRELVRFIIEAAEEPKPATPQARQDPLGGT
jgi:hypothetical protein